VRSNTKYALGFLLTISIFMAFQVYYFNKFLPIQEAWFIEYAMQMNSGKIIYNDFHVFIQPIYVFLFSVLQDLFGSSIIVFRYYGLFERALLVGLVYLLISLFANPLRSVYLSLLCLFFFSSNTADVIYSYYQLTVIFSLASAYSLILFYKNNSFLAIVAAGILSGLAFMTKQSTGLLVPVSLLLVMSVASYSGLFQRQKLTVTASLFMMGLLLPVSIILGYLAHLDALGSYWTQVFESATSKGSYLNMLTGFWLHMLSTIELLLLVATLTFLYKLSQKRWRRWVACSGISEYIDSLSKYWKFLGLVFLSIAALIPYFITYPEVYTDINNIYIKFNVMENRYKIVYVSMFFNAFLVCYYFYKAVNHQLTLDKVPEAVISVVSFSILYGHGLSGYIEPHGAVISLALFFSWLFKIKIPCNQIKNLALYLLMIFTIGMTSFEKSSWMYSWWGWDERLVWKASHEPKSSLLNGFLLNEDKARILDEITLAIEENSKETDSIYTFPHMPLFYLLTNRSHDTFSAVHYFDVCSDVLATSDAKVIESTKPKVIIVMYFPDSAWEFHEAAFRQGKRSGQRDIKELIEKFKNNRVYQSVGTFTTSGYGYKIEVLSKI